MALGGGITPAWMLTPTEKDGYYVTYDWSDEHNQYIAVISKGSPQRGDKDVVVCDVELFDHVADIMPWFEKMMREKPWQPN